MDTRKIQAKRPDTPDHGSTSQAIGDSPSPKRSAAALLSEIRRHLEIGEIRKAKRLTSDAARRHPVNAAIRDLDRTLNQGRSFTRPGTGRDMRPEYEWLRDPPEKYRGRWVALIGDAVVAAAATLQELQASLPSDLDQTPLAIQLPT